MYKIAVTFGRFNVPHKGHVELIEAMLLYAETAQVNLSTGKYNTNWATRKHLLSHLCRKARLDMSRIEFVATNSPIKAVDYALDEVEPDEVVVVMGTDQEHMARSLAERFGVQYATNERTESSTHIRSLLDNPCGAQAVRDAYENDPWSIVVVRELRAEERLSRVKPHKFKLRNREKSSSSSGKAKQDSPSGAGT